MHWAGPRFRLHAATAAEMKGFRFGQACSARRLARHTSRCRVLGTSSRMASMTARRVRDEERGGLEEEESSGRRQHGGGAGASRGTGLRDARDAPSRLLRRAPWSGASIVLSRPIVRGTPCLPQVPTGHPKGVFYLRPVRQRAAIRLSHVVQPQTVKSRVDDSNLPPSRGARHWLAYMHAACRVRHVCTREQCAAAQRSATRAKASL